MFRKIKDASDFLFNIVVSRNNDDEYNNYLNPLETSNTVIYYKELGSRLLACHRVIISVYPVAIN